MRNGQLLQGRVARVGDHYEVVIPGGEIHVKAANVQCLCRGVAEVYEHRRAIMGMDSAQEHLEMAQWCLRVGLADAGRAELSEAKALDRTHPLIPLVERRFQLAAASRPVKATAAAATQTGPSVDELDRMIRSMPPKTVETFARTVQPMLVNNCAASGCHGPASGKGFQLTRLPAGGPPSPRLTQRNLHATLQYLDWQNPEASPLVRVPAGPHGTARSAVFTTLQQYKQLVDWCCRVAHAPSPVMQARYEEPIEERVMVKRPDGDNRPSSRGRRPAVGRPSAEGENPSGEHHPVGNLRVENARKPSLPLRQSAGRSPAEKLPQGTVGPAVPRRGATAAAASDPFDPELFNRRFAPPDPPPPSQRQTESPPRTSDPDDPPLPP